MAEPWYVAAYDERYYQNYKDEFTPEQTAADVDGVIALLGLTPGARVLDVCCGFGRHSLELARRGMRVTGLDLSRDLLAHARAASKTAGLNIEWINADMRDIPTPQAPYDAVINLFSSLGFFGDDSEEANAVRAMGNVTASHGRILIETVNREVMLRRWMPMRWREGTDGTLACDRLRFDIHTGILHTEEVAVQPDGTRARDTHQLRLWAFTELRAMLNTSGFQDVTAYGSLAGSAYTWDSHRLAVIGTQGVKR